MKKILIVDDEVKLRNELKSFLESNDYSCIVLEDFSNTVSDILNTTCDLVLLDINLPFMDGEIICRDVRRKSDIPIIMITSRNTMIDELLSINYGADDYVIKPYNLQILLARINRIFKRGENDTITYEDMVVDITKLIIKRGDVVISLSFNEMRILSFLLKNRGTVLSRDEIMNYLWDNDQFIDDNTLTVNINRLRTRLLEVGLKDVIVTKRGCGYIIL